MEICDAGRRKKKEENGQELEFLNGQKEMLPSLCLHLAESKNKISLHHPS